MSLFPAYALDDVETGIDMQVREVSPVREAQLLESDEEPAPARRSPLPRAAPPASDDHFYLDPKSDYGNLRFSTLYYPGRPRYTYLESTLGGSAPARARAGRKRRYFECAAAEPPRADDELAARVAAFRRMLADAPHDVHLWLRFIRFQERCGGAGAALETAAQAATAAPHSRALDLEHDRLQRQHLPADAYLAGLRARIAAGDRRESRPAATPGQTALWLRLVEALGRAGGADAAQAVGAAARAAARATAHHDSAYPHLVAVYGSFLRAAGLWELLVMLVELLATMSFPPSGVFPPPPDDARAAAAEERLLRLEDEVAACGLPLHARWVRVERARAAAHWRPAPAAADDPQRAPHPADLADLLLPVADADGAFLLAAQLLRLAKVPMLPGDGAVRFAFAAGAEAADECGEALLPLLRAARRLPAAHAARAPPGVGARLLALLVDPPHYFSDDAGFLSWVNALWTACCSWTEGDRRVALLCWWLRWLQALASACDGRAELQRMRVAARAALRAHAGASPLPFAQFARLERLVTGEEAAAAAARRAARAACADPDLPQHRRLYVARVADDLSCDGSGPWATVCAALGRPLPPDERLRAPPPAALRDAALAAAEQRCRDLEEELLDAPDDREERGGARLCAALLPGAGEWAAARARLAGPRRRRDLLLRAHARAPRPDRGWAAARYLEQEACALAAAARDHHGLAPAARLLAPRFPHNAFLALAASSGCGAWAGWTAPGVDADADAARRTECGALAELLPPLLRAAAAWGAAGEAGAAEAWRAAARAARRVARAGGAGATAWAALLEAAARAHEPGLEPARALPPATEARPQHKWLYVRGAAWGGEGAALADALLDRQLRLHALPEELTAAAEAAAECRAAAGPASFPADTL